jgi:GAF domain-containing protein/PAS domain-containing protein
VALANHTALVSRDGREIPIEDSAAPIRDDTGKISGAVLVFHDVTERRRAREALQQKEADLREAQRVSHVGSWYWDAKTDATTGSDELLRIYGFDPKTQSMPAFREQKGLCYPAADWELVNAAVQETVQTGIGYRLDVRAIRNGEPIWVTTRGEVVRAADGQIVGLRGTDQDITERKRAEATLSQSESRFKLLSETSSRLLASQTPQAIVKDLCLQVMEHLDCHAFFNFLVDEAAGKLHLNACAGIPEEEARNIEWLDYGVAVCGCAARDGKRIVTEDIFNTPDVRTELVKSYGIQAYACHPLEVQGKTIGTLSFGTKTRKHFSAEDLALMKTVADQVATAMEKLRLIDELRSSRDELEIRVRERTVQLEHSNQALQDFTSIAAHDLQEPLRKISSFGNLIKQKHGDGLGQNAQDYLDRMLGASSRMQTLLTSRWTIRG